MTRTALRRASSSFFAEALHAVCHEGAGGPADVNAFLLCMTRELHHFHPLPKTVHVVRTK